MAAANKFFTSPLTTVVAPLALGLVVAAVYWPAFFAGFIWDDNKFILEEAAMQGLAGLGDIWLRPERLVESHYWPLLYTTFWLEHKLWGFNPAGFHTVNILLHGANTVLLWFMLRRITLPGAWFVAAVFAVHPVHVEAVAWIIARKDLLATLFYLLAFTCWLRFQETGNRKKNRSKRRAAYLGLLGFYSAALLSKTIAITLPLVLLLHLWWRDGRISGRLVLQIVPLLLLGFALGTYGLSRYEASGVIAFDYSFAERLIIASKALWFYAGKLLWPQPLLFIYPHWDVSPQRLLNWLPLLGAVVLAAALYLSRHRIGRGPLAGLLFFALTLSPTLGFVSFRYMQFSFVADRYQYFALVGIVTVLVGGAATLLQRYAAQYNGTLSGGSWAARGGAVVLALLLVVYSGLSLQRARLFQDQVPLFRHVVATNPGAYESGHILGTFLMEREQWQEAEAAYRDALIHDPTAVKIHANLGSVLMQQGRYEDAVHIMQEAVLLEASATETATEETRRYEAAAVRINLSLALLHLERLDEAEAALRRALELQPGSREARLNLVLVLNHQAVAHFNAGRYQEAIAPFEESAALNPDAQTFVNLGSVLGQLGRYEEAAAHFEQALAIDPSHESARSNLEMLRRQAAVPDGNSPDGI